MTVRIGLIGAGGIMGAHVRGYQAIPEQVSVTAVADVVAENAQQRAQEVGATEVFADYHRMLETDIDAVDIGLPHHLHAEAILAAAAAGKHVLCEKPLCLSVEEANAIDKAVQQSGITLMCAHNQLFMPAVAHTKKLIEEGTFGRVYELRTTDSFFNNFDPKNMGWRAHRETAGGGELIDTGYHPTYLLLHLAGARPTQVTSMVSKHRLEFMEGEDSAQVLVRFDNDAVGSIVTSWAYNAAPGTERFSLVGEKGSLSSDGRVVRYQLTGADPVVTELDQVDAFAAEIADFVRCVRDGDRPINTHTEGIDVLKVILGAYESADTQRIVTLAQM